MAVNRRAARSRTPPIREIVTPEGVALHVTLASRGDRIVAVLIDLAFIGLALAVMVIGCLVFLPSIGLNWAYSLGIVLSFGIRSFYFIFFELRWQGMTPGKRIMKLRVMDWAGGRLRANAVFARNLMREVELFIPLNLMLTGTGDLEGLLTLLWTGALMALPFFNRDRLRGGDIVAGTWVVENPKIELLPDIAIPGQDARSRDIHFTPAQLSIYGVYELQTLESVLRQDDPYGATLDTVAQTIQTKIGWTPADEKPVDASDFLQAFYAALRGHLEHNALFRKPRANKFDQA